MFDYSVMYFGGSLGIGDSYHPLPWHVLTYDTGQGGYVVDLDRRRLEGAPSYRTGAEPDWSDQTYRRSIDEYYGGSVHVSGGISPSEADGRSSASSGARRPRAR